MKKQKGEACLFFIVLLAAVAILMADKRPDDGTKCVRYQDTPAGLVCIERSPK